MNYLIFAIATIGLTNILVHGKILDDQHLGWRNSLKEKLGSYGDVLDCYECTGFWSGLILSFFLITYNPFVMIACGFVGTVLAQGYSELVLYIQSKTDFVIQEENGSETS